MKIMRRMPAQKTSQLSAHVSTQLLDELYQKIIKERIPISWILSKLIEGFLRGEYKVKMFDEDD